MFESSTQPDESTQQLRSNRRNRLRRRSVLRALGGGAVAFGVTPGVVSGASVDDVRSGGRPSQISVNGSDSIRRVPLWGGCDAARGDTECGDGVTGIYDQTGWGGRIGLGSHTYQLRIQGLPWPTFEVLLQGAGPITVGLPFQRFPPPPSSDLDYGPYDLVVNGIQIDIDVVEDRAAPQRLVHADCEVPQSCQQQWCDAVDRTVDALDESAETLQQSLWNLQRSMESRVFRVTVAQKSTERAARLRLGAKILTALRTEIFLLRAEMSGNRPTVDVSDACEGCPPCIETPRVKTVRNWELRLSERSRATAALDDMDAWAHHELEATVRLDPAGAAGAEELAERGDGPLGGILSGVARLLGEIGRLFGGTPNGWMGQPVEATAWRSSGYVAESDNGTISVVNTANGSYAAGEPTPDVAPNERSDFAQLTLHADDNEYELGFPQLPVAGTSVTFGLPSDASSSFNDSVGYGAEIVRRAGSVDESQSSTFRFPLGDTAGCGSRLSGGVEVSLDDGGVVPSTYTSVAGVDGAEGVTASGRASVEWELVPLTYGSANRRVLKCQ